MEKLYDCIILGAGTAGLSAAMGLKGLDYLILDKKSSKHRLRNSDAVTRADLLEKLGLEDCIENRYDHVQIHAGDTWSKYKTDKFAKVDMVKMHHKLLDKSSSWDKLKLNESVKSVESYSSFAEVITDKGSYRAKMVIDATGSRKATSKSPKKMFPCLELRIKGCNIDDYKTFSTGSSDDLVLKTEKGKILGKLGDWFYPVSKEEAVMGMTLFVKDGKFPPNMKSRLLKYMKAEEPYKTYFENAYVVGTKFNVIPLDRHKAYGNRILRCGDAGGLLPPASAEGIVTAFRSGKVAARWAKKALDKEKYSSWFLRGYSREWRKKKHYSLDVIFNEILYKGYLHDKTIAKMLKTLENLDEDTINKILMSNGSVSEHVMKKVPASVHYSVITDYVKSSIKQNWKRLRHPSKDAKKHWKKFYR